MAGGVNKVILIGNLGVDPEVRYTPQGTAIATFRIATNESWTDKSGQRQDRTEWHRIVVWGRQGELCGEYLSKGRQVFLEGRLQTREWTDKENHKNYTTEVVATHVVFLGSQAPGQGANPNPNPRPRTAPAATGANAAATSTDDFGPPPPEFDDPATPAAGGGPSEDDIPF